MSPNEAQLRAALHHGEGDSPDAGALISHAVRVRRQRQRRITSIVTGTTVVAVVAAGVGLLVSLGTGSESGGGGTASRPAAGAGAALQGTANPPAAGPMMSDGAGSGASRFSTAEKAPARAVRLICPPAPVRYMLPGGGGIGAYGSTEKLFVRSVVAMKICAYPKIPARTPVSTVLTAADAHQFATALESAPARTITPGACPSDSAVVGTELEVLAVSGDAKRLVPVVITVGPCFTSQVTNGTAVRYLATLPRSVTKLLDSAARVRPPPTKPANGSAPS
jgi:hypothetical protein